MMLVLAIVCAVAAACCYSAAARLQQRAVHHATAEPVLRLAEAKTVLRNPGWNAGLGFMAAGASLHIFALTLAPLVVVQPIGVLSLVLTVLAGAGRFRPAVLGGTLISVAGVAVFVALSAHPTTVTSLPQLGNAQWVLLPAALLAVSGWRAPARRRCVLLALATAVLFGLSSSMVRAAGLLLSHGLGMTGVAIAEAVAAAVCGSWLLHQAYASGPATIVVGATTIVDPLTAVTIGALGYGESVPTTGLLPAVAAMAGLVVLAGTIPARSGTPVRTAPGQSLRVLIAADTYPPTINGAANFAQRLANGLSARGHEVHVVCPSTDNRDDTAIEDGVTVHRIAAIRTPFHRTFRICPPWRAARTVPALVSRIQPDLIHSQAHFLIGRSAIRAGSAAAVPVVATNHFMPENLFGYGPLPAWTHRPLARLAWRDLVRVFRRANAVTAPTPRAVKLLEDNGLPGPAIAVSCGIDRARYQACTQEQATDPTVLFVGRLDAEKNVHELLRAAARLHARVELVGDGTERGHLEALAHELGIAERVTFHGFVPETELVRAYRRCAVFCMPGTAELQSLATMEAMAAGRPVVAADAMALPHLVHPGHNGWLYRPGDITDLTARLGAVLGDPTTRAAMGQASLELVARHDIENTLEIFEQLYRDVTGSHPQHGTSAAALAAGRHVSASHNALARPATPQ